MASQVSPEGSKGNVKEIMTATFLNPDPIAQLVGKMYEATVTPEGVKVLALADFRNTNF